MAHNQPVPADRSPLYKAAINKDDLAVNLEIVIVDQEQGIVVLGTVMASPVLYRNPGNEERPAVLVKLESGEQVHFYLDYLGIVPYASHEWSKTVFTIRYDDLSSLPRPLPLLQRDGTPSALPPINW